MSFSFANKRVYKHTHKNGNSNFIRVWETNKKGTHAVNLGICQEEGEGEKVMVLKFGIEIRDTVRKPWISGKACLGFDQYLKKRWTCLVLAADPSSKGTQFYLGSGVSRPRPYD